MSFKLVESDSRAKIKVIGVGGGGGNAVNTMVESKMQGVQFIAANTDCQALEVSKADIKLQIGPTVTKGLGAGARPEKGRDSAEESIDEIRKILKDSDMVFVTVGLGGGTGTGAAPVVARVAKELGALTVAVTTKPFVFEGKTRMRNAEKGWDELRKHVDTIITIPNDRLLSLSSKGGRFIDGMKQVDDVLVQAVKGITDLINLPGYINPDFADVRTVMNEMGPALMGAGTGVGENRATAAVNAAIASPLLQDISIDGARGVLVNISASKETLTMAEVTEASSKIYEEVHDDANIILGVIFDDSLGEELRVTVIATGIRSAEQLDTLPEAAVKSVPQKQEAVGGSSTPYLPFSGREGRDESPGATIAKGKPRGGFYPQKGLFDEEELERPTFLRRNEN